MANMELSAAEETLARLHYAMDSVLTDNAELMAAYPDTSADFKEGVIVGIGIIHDILVEGYRNITERHAFMAIVKDVEIDLTNEP